jgi:hypothetical protein
MACEESKGGSPPGMAAGVRLSTGAFVALLACVVAPWLFLAARVQPSDRTVHVSPAGAGRPDAEIRSGPWGDLELVRITIAPSEELLPPGWSQLVVTAWFFSGHTEDSLRRFFGTLNLSEEERTALLNVETWTVEADGVTVHPPDKTIISLAPEARVAIYAALARSSRNGSHREPWSVRTNAFEEVMASFGLSQETRTLLRRISYTHGRRIFVSDGNAILNFTADREEKLRFARVLSSDATFVVHLKLGPGADIDRLVSYWGGRGRRKDLRPMLESLTALPGGGGLDIAHLLPAFARQRLYIYPHPVLALDGVGRDCHWTSFNFFSLVPDDRFGKPEEVRKDILDHFYQIGESPQFGDLVFFTTPNGGIIHSCVYLAANLVFTKNGDSTRQPWSIMDLDDVVDLYSLLSPDEIRVTHWRDRNFEE